MCACDDVLASVCEEVGVAEDVDEDVAIGVSVEGEVI